jgi:hypothetical protein
MYSVHQHWDPLKVCLVGKSYPPEFYNFIKNTRVRTVMERIAEETEEDYLKLVKLLESFGVTTLRPDIGDSIEDHWDEKNKKYFPPPMTPRDYSAMVANTFYFSYRYLSYKKLFDGVIDHVKDQGNPVIIGRNISSAELARVGKDLYHGTSSGEITEDAVKQKQWLVDLTFPEHRNHIINTSGHSDAVYCPVKPGLIVSLFDVPTYAETYPGWEVVYLRSQSWRAIPKFLHLKERNRGKWWVPGEELNDEFTEFVEGWLNHWVGYVEETVFDVNMLVVDEKNVICNNYNKQVFEAFERHGVTPHILNFRHRYFWDGGLHCITSDLHRVGTQQDYFPTRG